MKVASLKCKEPQHPTLSSFCEVLPQQVSHADVLRLLSLHLKLTCSDIWVTLREEAFNHGSTSGPPLTPSGASTANHCDRSRKFTPPAGAGQWKSFSLDLKKKIGCVGVVSCRSPNPITSTEQCLQQGINPTARSPCSKPGRQRRVGRLNQDFLFLFTSHLR